ncbi:MAG: PD40 domain-containing protein [Candidatus Omnitrophica bacterium]|nr:PD40 domain-containing protein [Candidatus Omnitrophota bacterium]
MTEGRRITGGLILILLAVGAPVLAGEEFGIPERVYIDDLPPGAFGQPLSTEEPFISREGRVLFFNSGDKENKKDLHFARLVHGRWVYQGEIGGVNSRSETQGAASLDRGGNLYYVDTRAPRMLRVGHWQESSGTVTAIEDFTAVPARRPELFRGRIHGNMDIEISADGNTAVISRATWGWEGGSVRYIQTANLLVSRRQGKKFVFNLEESERLMQNINTDDLEYAAALSANGLELFFTRLAADDLAHLRLRSRIMRATRASDKEPFGPPQTIGSIGTRDFVEGPALSPDGRRLYYHRKTGKKFHLYRVTRP